MKIQLSKFAKFAWFVLIYNIIVVVWGVFLRASKSGDGCGQYWFTCHNEIIPTAPELKTVIEFSHRLMSGVDFFIVLGLMIWVLRKFAKGEQIRKFAVVSFIFIITEAVIGGILVLSGNTAEANTPVRPFLAISHLLNTFILIASLSLTAWLASGGKPFTLKNKGKYVWLLALGIFGFLLVGTSGSLAALSSMLYETKSLSEGLQQDFAGSSPLLLRLRISHPILSILVGVGLVFLAGWLKSKAPENPSVVRWSGILSILVIIQIAFGGLTLFLLAPIVMQLGHLLLADLMWISFVLMWAAFLAEDVENLNQSGE
jgi:heme A synthase